MKNLYDYTFVYLDRYGNELKNLSSEILASLLLQEDLMEELINFINEVEQEEIFND